MCLEYKNINFTRELIDLKNKPESYLKLNKKGSVPTLVCGDKIICDSGEILKYLD